MPINRALSRLLSELHSVQWDILRTVAQTSGAAVLSLHHPPIAVATAQSRGAEVLRPAVLGVGAKLDRRPPAHKEAREIFAIFQVEKYLCSSRHDTSVLYV
jgi:hypothetical protein